MIIKGQLLWTDYLDAQLLHLRPEGLARTIVFVVLGTLGLGLLGCLLLSFATPSILAFLLPVVFVGAFVALYRFVLLPNRIKKLFAQQKELSLPFELEITGDGLRVSNELGSGLRPWSHFTKWKEGTSLLMLYHSDVLFSIVPKRFLSDPSHADEIKSHLAENNVAAEDSRQLLKIFALGCIIYIILFAAVLLILFLGARNGAIQ